MELQVRIARLAALGEFVLLAFIVHFICERDAAQHGTGQWRDKASVLGAGFDFA